MIMEDYFIMIILSGMGAYIAWSILSPWWDRSDNETRRNGILKGLAVIFILGGARVYFNTQNDETASASASLVLATLGLA
ncbi:hypothetical protein OAU47_03805 [Pelagibacterales bacterium]|nr:hypothetical protein [Pelagibacterales bacterium]